MTPLPIPWLNEADLATKIGANVIKGLKKSAQPRPWPNTQDSLMEVLAILELWDHRAQYTAMYADALFRARQSGKISSLDNATSALTYYGEGNIARAYAQEMWHDSHRLLIGRIPLLSRLSASRRRQAERRSLRTVLITYCPDLLERLEEATAARVSWVEENRQEFEHWFDGSRSDEEIKELVRNMETTRTGLEEVKVQVRNFIAANFPMPQMWSLG